MFNARIWQKRYYVALLAEGVDRNWLGAACGGGSRRSPSSRRAWIEITFGLPVLGDI